MITWIVLVCGYVPFAIVSMLAVTPSSASAVRGRFSATIMASVVVPMAPGTVAIASAAS